jgi:hypothetical protein
MRTVTEEGSDMGGTTLQQEIRNAALSYVHKPRTVEKFRATPPRSLSWISGPNFRA